MMKILKTLVLITAISIMSCKKQGKEKNTDTIDSSNPTISKNIYICGYERNFNNILVAKYWVNGIETILGNGLQDTKAFSITATDKDVYVAGAEFNGNEWKAKIWKNGVGANLLNGTEAHSVTVFGNDVYAAGYEFNGTRTTAKMWKNGVPTTLQSGVNDAGARAIAINGTNIYVVGSVFKSGLSYRKPVIWKNGVLTYLDISDELENRSTLVEGHATSVFVSGADVYVAGHETISGFVSNQYYYNHKAKYWKNDTPINLTDSITYAQPNSICVEGNNVYVAGYNTMSNVGNPKNLATVWKNGKQIIKIDNFFSTFESIVVDNSATYIVGSEYSSENGFIARFWVNGVLTPLKNNPTFGSEFKCIFLK